MAESGQSLLQRIGKRRSHITASDQSVIDVARHYGVEPQQVLGARRQVKELRSIARKEATHSQDEALTDLERFNATRLKTPPRKNIRNTIGVRKRGGEYDFLDRLSRNERNRLSRKWFKGISGPDVIASSMESVLGGDLSTDEAMQKWMDLNRRADAAGALRRGKLPSVAAYSGQIDSNTLVPNLSSEGYDMNRLFGNKLDAAGYIAGFNAEQAEDEALHYLGAAVKPVEGPAPYRMSFESWQGEVSDLEYDIAHGGLRGRTAARYAELVPEHLNEAKLGYEGLHAKILATANKAGELITPKKLELAAGIPKRSVYKTMDAFMAARKVIGRYGI